MLAGSEWQSTAGKGRIDAEVAAAIASAGPKTFWARPLSSLGLSMRLAGDEPQVQTPSSAISNCQPSPWAVRWSFLVSEECSVEPPGRGGAGLPASGISCAATNYFQAWPRPAASMSCACMWQAEVEGLRRELDDVSARLVKMDLRSGRA